MCDGAWYLAIVRSGAERLAEAELMLDGPDTPLDVYAPMIAVLSRPHRCPRKKVILKPAFSGYLFIRGELQEIYPRLEQSSRCYRLAAINYEPLTVSEPVISRIKEQEIEWRKHPIVSRGSLIIGEHVAVTDGPFVNFSGVILDIRKKTAEVALAIRGKLSYRLWAPLDWLKKIPLDASS
jgi:transcription antitermination factor NusG